MKVEQNIFQNSVRQWMLLKIHALPFFLNQKIEGRCSEKVTDFNEEIANRTSENDAKTNSRGSGSISSTG